MDFFFLKPDKTSAGCMDFTAERGSNGNTDDTDQPDAHGFF